MKVGTRRLISVGVVVSAVALAVAAPGASDGIELAPRIRVIKHQNGNGGSGAVTLLNTTPSPFGIGSITYSCGAPPAMQLLGGSGSLPFQLAGNGGTKTIVIECPSSLPLGMQRCTFTVNDSTNNPIVSFLGVCETDGMPVLQRNVSPLVFGTVAVGTSSSPLSVSISNPNQTLSVDTLQLQLDDENFLLGSPCSSNVTGCDASGVGPLAGGSSSVQVICHPTKTGPLTGKLFVTGDNGFFLAQPVDLSCNGGPVGVPVLGVSPNAINLTTPVEVQNGSASGLVQLQNTGSGSLSITGLDVVDRSVANAKEDWTFAVSGTCATETCTLMANDTLNVNLTFDPSTLNGRPARLVINYDDGGAKQATVDLDGIGQGATLELVGTNTTLNFGTLALGMPGTQTFSLKNLGNRPTTALLQTSPMAPFTFPASVVVNPGVNPIVMVTCQSATAVSVVGRPLTVSSTDLMTPFDLTLNCDVRDTQLIANPTSIDLGEILTSTMPRHQPITVSRVGAGPAIPLAPLVLAMPNPKLTLNVQSPLMTPLSLDLQLDLSTDGSLDALINVSSTQGGIMPITIPVTGAVVTAGVTTPTVVSLGTFCVGQPTTSSILTLKSIGTATIDLPTAPAMKTDPSPFDVRAGTPSIYPTMLSPEQEATAEVTPKRGIAAGVQSDVLVWTTTQSGKRETMVSATFAADGGAIAPDALTFDAVPIRLLIDNAKPVTLQNCDLTPLELVVPVVPSPFELDGEFPTVLQPGERATFGIVFHPTQVGHFSETLVVTSKAGDMFPVMLIGDGVADGGSGDDDGGGLDHTSFYACSGCTSNEPSGVLTIAIAAMCALVPRRRRR